MDKPWQLDYDVYTRIFGLAFLLLTGLRAYASICASNTFFTRSRVGYAVNGVFILFTSSRAFILLLNRPANEEGDRSPYERFLFNIGFPCLLTAYIRLCYHCLWIPKHHMNNAFYLVVSQSFFFIIGDTFEAMGFSDQCTEASIIDVLNSCAFLCGLSAIIVYVKVFYNNSFDNGTDINEFELVSVVTTTGIHYKAAVIDNKTKSASCTEPIITLVILFIGTSCAVIKLGIMTRLFQASDSIYMKSWEYATILRMIEMGSGFMLWSLTKHINL